MQQKEEVKDLLSKYKSKIEKELSGKVERSNIDSKTYQDFKKEFYPQNMSLYEKAAKFCGHAQIKPSEKAAANLQEAIELCHLSITPTDAMSFAMIIPMIIMLIGSFVGYLIPFLLSGGGSLFFVIIFLIMGAVLISPLSKLPLFFANTWRMNASNQMIICIFYIVTYMRHTSNLERAIQFATDHLSPPLSVDLRKVLWDVETQKYGSIEESIESYLTGWKKWNEEFIEAFHLIESSLSSNSEEKRLATLDKSLDIILEGTYEKMLHYAHNLKSPITMLNMLGIILPILGLVILPLVVGFMSAETSPFMTLSVIFMLYNIILPIGVYFFGKNILANRPSGYGDTDISETAASLKKEFISPKTIAILFGVVFLIIGFSPLILHAAGFPDFRLDIFNPEEVENSPCGGNYCFMEYKISSAEKGPMVGKEIGPFGIGASVLSLLVTSGIGLSIGIYLSLKTKKLMVIRENSKKLEKEFTGALFQLGNRLDDGIPAEMACGKVADVLKGSASGNFFRIVSNNIKKLGMGVERSIFDKQYGALVYFPSAIIESSMKVLTESIKKGSKIAATALKNVSRYITEIHKVDERLKDLLADDTSSISAQIKFLTPAIAGIVIGITSMITNIIGKIGSQLKDNSSSDITGASNLGAFSFGDSVPTFYFQIIVGLYVVQIIMILSMLLVGIKSGADKLEEKHEMGKNLIKSVTLYCIISLVVMILFNSVAASIMNAQLGG